MNNTEILTPGQVMVKVLFDMLRSAVEEDRRQDELQKIEEEAKARPQTDEEARASALAQFTQYRTPEGKNTVFDTDERAYADIVLIPTKNSVLVRGNRRLKFQVNRTFTGLGRHARAMAYVEGLAEMHAMTTSASNLTNSFSGHGLAVAVRLD